MQVSNPTTQLCRRGERTGLQASFWSVLHQPRATLLKPHQVSRTPCVNCTGINKQTLLRLHPCPAQYPPKASRSEQNQNPYRGHQDPTSTALRPRWLRSHTPAPCWLCSKHTKDWRVRCPRPGMLFPRCLLGLVPQPLPLPQGQSPSPHSLPSPFLTLLSSLPLSPSNILTYHL